MGAVIPEAAELPTQISRKICVESPTPAPGAFHGTDSLVLVLDDGKDFPDGASKQSNHEQESVPLVSSSIEAFCHSTAGNATEFCYGKRRQICLCGVWLCKCMSNLKQGGESTARWVRLGQGESCNYWSELSRERFCLLQSLSKFQNLMILPVVVLYISVHHGLLRCFRILLELLVWDHITVNLVPLNGTAVVSMLHFAPFMSADKRTWKKCFIAQAEVVIFPVNDLSNRKQYLHLLHPLNAAQLLKHLCTIQETWA